jgi:hypothetical protein
MQISDTDSDFSMEDLESGPRLELARSVERSKRAREDI